MDRLKTGFFTNISHELRTPMTVISGRLEMISQSVTDEKNRHALAIVMRNAQRVSTLITQLLDFRKIEEGKIKVEATRGDVVPLLRNWISSLQVLAEQKTILLSLESVEACRGSLDFDKLEKIVTNLLSNAIKYTKEGGEVRVLLNVMQEDTEHRLLHLAVEDTGLGISQEDLKHIFDRFYRVSEESMAMGAGIGLNLTKELVDLLGGEIRVNSPIHPDEERPGTRFSVYLPMDCKEAETSDEIEYIVPSEVIAAEVAPIPSSDEPVMKPSILKTETGEVPQILIVEDDEDIRNFIVEGLEPFYSVETAENGAIGLQKAKEFVPDLVVTDVMMPEMDGTAMCRELKTRLETSHIPVVMLTAKAALESQVEGLKTGADDYVIKPFHMELLQVRIANLLESRRLLREKFCREYSVLTPKIPENTPESKFLEKALSVLEEHYSDWEFNRDGFAAGLHMTVRTLHRKLKAVADRTPADFISEFRMIRGAELLKGSSGSITDIAFLVGYDNSSNFARMFKRFYKLSPSEYRKEHSSS
jgi:CheY-like chemotaxis protein/AraC-like DNA-binding protein/two-component sensor histidine kinase